MTPRTELLRDWWLPAALTALAVHEVGGGYGGLDRPGTALLAGLLPLVLLTGRRRHEPELVAVLVSLLAVVFALGVQGDAAVQPPLAAFLALLASLFSLGLHGSGPRFRAAALVAAALLGGLKVVSAAAGQSLDDVLPSTVFLVGALVVGRLLGTSMGEAEQSRTRAVAAEADRARQVAEATAAERSRIARELHDVVAHSLSLVVVQASVEARLLPDQSSSAAATLRSIEHQGRAALAELRRLLGLVRDDEPSALLRPLPTLAAVDDLVRDAEGAGLRVRLTRCAGGGELAPGVDLAAYRIVQEALTNAIRHAPGSHVEVTLARDSEAVLVSVENGPARRPPPALSGAGLGIAGMAERTRLYGGTLEAGATGSGGFRVRARIPVEVR